jgi:hypothetical protein
MRAGFFGWPGVGELAAEGKVTAAAYLINGQASQGICERKAISFLWNINSIPCLVVESDVGYWRYFPYSFDHAFVNLCGWLQRGQEAT